MLAYVAAESPQGADHVLDSIKATLALLCEQPRMGRAINRPGYRRIVVAPFPYVILYRPTVGEIVIHDVRQTARKPRGW